MSAVVSSRIGLLVAFASFADACRSATPSSSQSQYHLTVSAAESAAKSSRNVLSYAEFQPLRTSSAYDVVERYRPEFLAMSPPLVRVFNARRGRMIVALAAVRAGLPDSARHLADAASIADSTVDPRHQIMSLAAIVHEQLGDRDKAIELMSRIVKAAPHQRAAMANDKSWWLRDLRSDPRFQALILKRPH